ncbi:glutathione hydrolase 7 isoform X1 [Fundulus heteroclitus]|uniref:glutathione hydrolase 7 isoform X1 n=2 Tax=Fundulus heteroclitus TaxID=8078 RepID=UPI00165A89DE|nr:glutathione hydrolase 7 isoform X1 [Fundulus heteroclitus]
MSVSAETKLSKHLTCSYKSFGSSIELADVSSPDGFTSSHDDGDQPQGQTLKILAAATDPVQLKELPSGSQEPFEPTKLKETDEECCALDTPVQIYAVVFIFAIGVTIALVTEIYLTPLAFIKGVVSDHERCTALGEKVLQDRGSSVDAAIVGALCLGIVHPHVSGVGGGGVMLVHDSRRNQTKVINFQGSAPQALTEDMVQNASDVKAGLFVGVPGMLLGLHRAHRLYGSLSWDDVVSRAADVAREGFNVSQSLAAAISQLETEKIEGRLRDIFIPDGQALKLGSYLRMPGLAEVLEAGFWNFYHGPISEEMEKEVIAKGGVLTREDIRDYSVEVQQPLEGRYNEHIIQVPPPPSAGVALIAALNILESLFVVENNVTENQTSRWIEEALTRALTMVGELGDPNYNSSVTDLSAMISKGQGAGLQQRMKDFQQSSHASNSTIHRFPTEQLTGQVIVMGPDDLMVSVASSLSRPFGSRIVTESGIILNSLILDFFWPNQMREHPQSNQKNSLEPGKRPLTFLMPAMMVPTWNKCGSYMALSSSGGPNRLSEVTQMLVGLLFLHKEKNDTLSTGGLPPQLSNSTFPEESV